MKEEGETSAYDFASTIPHINVTPLIDVLLVMLIIFMTITPLKPTRFKALIPQPPDPADNSMPNQDALVVSINQDLTLKLNHLVDDFGSVNDTAKLSAALHQVFVQREANSRNVVPLGALPLGAALGRQEGVSRTVMIAAPRSIAYGEVAKVIDSVRGAGATPIGLQIDNLNP